MVATSESDVAECPLSRDDSCVLDRPMEDVCGNDMTASWIAVARSAVGFVVSVDTCLVIQIWSRNARNTDEFSSANLAAWGRARWRNSVLLASFTRVPSRAVRPQMNHGLAVLPR